MNKTEKEEEEVIDLAEKEIKNLKKVKQESNIV